MDKYVLWAGLLGAFSAISLLIGSLIGVSTRLPKSVTGLLAAFGAGALLSALTIELVAPTVNAMISASANDRSHATHNFFLLISGCAVGGLLFVLLDQMVNARGGYLRKTAYVVSKFSLERKNFRTKAISEIMNVSLFSRIPPEKINIVIDLLRPRFFLKGEKIFSVGDESQGLYVIRKGLLELDLTSQDKIVNLSNGEILGEISLFSESKHSANCVAVSDVELLHLTKADFMSIRKLVPELEDYLKDLADKRLNENISHVEKSVFEKQQWAKIAIDAIHHGSHIPSREQLISRHTEHNNAAFAIWLGILLDGIPESFIIGTTLLAAVTATTLAGGDPSFWSIAPYTLIAGLFLSNLPEALSSSQQMKMQGIPTVKVLLLWGSLVVITGLGAALGAHLSENIDHGTMVFVEGIAAGAMLTMICAAMLPEAVHLANSNLVGLSTLAGFISSVMFKLLE